MTSLIIWQGLSSGPFAEAGPKQSQQSMGRGFTITLGIMPSYTSSEEGLVIDSISKPDGPAAKAGIKRVM